jgi:hypothetical protein
MSREADCSGVVLSITDPDLFVLDCLYLYTVPIHHLGLALKTYLAEHSQD